MRIKNIQPAAPVAGVVGKIKIGEKNDRGVPRSLDYFKPCADAQYVALFAAAYGERPSNITVTFLTDDPEQAIETFYELRSPSDGKRIARGDGQTFYVATPTVIAGQQRIIDQVQVPSDAKAFMAKMAQQHNAEWKTVGVLRVALPKVPIIGVWEIRTQGESSSIKNLTAAVDQVYAMAGRLAGIPFDLSVRVVKSDKAGSKSRFPVLSLMANITVEAIEQVSMLPSGFHGLLTQDKVMGLSAGEPVARVYSEPEPETEEYVDYEEEQPVWEQYAENWGLFSAKSINDLTEYVNGLRSSSLTNEEKVKAFKLAENMAIQKGYKWQKNTGRFVAN